MKYRLVTKRYQAYFFIFISLILSSSWLLFTCVNPFAPKLEDSAELDFLITEQKNPNEVLQNFKLAYFFRDSILYSDVLDSDFVFYYFDPNLETSGRYVNWNRMVDLRITGSLFRAFDVINLIWESTVYQDTISFDAASEPNQIEIIKRFSLKFTDTSSGVDFNLWGKAYFTFIKNNYDHKWRITRWKDESFY